jgi:hypothetical protein
MYSLSIHLPQFYESAGAIPLYSLSGLDRLTANANPSILFLGHTVESYRLEEREEELDIVILPT